MRNRAEQPQAQPVLGVGAIRKRAAEITWCKIHPWLIEHLCRQAPVRQDLQMCSKPMNVVHREPGKKQSLEERWFAKVHREMHL